MDGVVRDAILEPRRVGTRTVTWKVTYLIVNKDVSKRTVSHGFGDCAPYLGTREALCDLCVNPLENIFLLITGSTIIYGIYKLHVQQFYVVNYRDIKVSAYMYVRLLGKSIWS